MNDKIVIFRRLKIPKDVSEIQRKYSNREYNRLSTLSNDGLTDLGYEAINNWRLLHAYPLDEVSAQLNRIAQQVNKKNIASKRIKRIASITPKISKGYELTQIQDIGGCRVVFETYEEILTCIERLKTIDIFSSVRVTDYIQTPKESGYRSVHLVCTYKSDDKRYNGLKIEIQLRTFTQHTWATALEVVDVYTKQNLKGGQGSSYWLRFFSLFSSYQAKKENLPLLPNASDMDSVMREIFDLNTLLNATTLLQGVTLNYDHLPEIEKISPDYYLLHCSIQTLKVHYFYKDEYEKAFEKYLAMEKEEKNTNNIVALVSVDDVKNLQEAYPNYFNDTHGFVSDILQVTAWWYANKSKFNKLYL